MTPFFQRIATLILKKLRQELRHEEREELEAWAQSSAENRKLYSELIDEDLFHTTLKEFYESDQNTWSKIELAVEQPVVTPVRRMRPWRVVAAASVAILLAACAFWLFNYNSKNIIAKTPTLSTVKLEDIKAPTGNNSTLTLGDGTIVILDEVGNGQVAHQTGSSIIKTDSALEYRFETSGIDEIESPSYNTITTRRGGQQQVLLPDGSRVWLNTKSSITYPTFFTGNERKVRLTGEAYFEIESISINNTGNRMPFIVEILSNSQEFKGEVEVIGTHFNINAYDDENIVKTTLLEGKVRIANNSLRKSESVMLKPGQQAELSADKIKVIKDADLDEAMAWRNNDFVFRSVDVETIFRQASRWYDISVSYPHGKPKDRFSGPISRRVNLSQFLEIFKESDLKFKLENNNQLIVLP